MDQSVQQTVDRSLCLFYLGTDYLVPVDMERNLDMKLNHFLHYYPKEQQFIKQDNFKQFYLNYLDIIQTTIHKLNGGH